MGIFNAMFGGNKEPKEEKKLLPWKSLTSMSQLEEIAKVSEAKPVAIFKHSTTCGISRMALRQFESQYNISENSLDIYYLDLKAYREVSNEIAVRFQILHESPQLILIKNGTTVYAESHGNINAAILADKV